MWGWSERGGGGWGDWPIEFTHKVSQLMTFHASELGSENKSY